MFSSGSFRPNTTYGAVPLAEELGEVARKKKDSKKRGRLSCMFSFLRREEKADVPDDDEPEEGRTS